MSTSDLIGFVGVTILLIAFLLNLSGKFPSNTALYSVLNIIGAGLACLASILISYLPFIILEGSWTLVAIISLIKALVNKQQAS